MSNANSNHYQWHPINYWNTYWKSMSFHKKISIRFVSTLPITQFSRVQGDSLWWKHWKSIVFLIIDLKFQVFFKIWIDKQSQCLEVVIHYSKHWLPLKMAVSLNTFIVVHWRMSLEFNEWLIAHKFDYNPYTNGGKIWICCVKLVLSVRLINGSNGILPFHFNSN